MHAPRKEFYAIFHNEKLEIIYLVQKELVRLPLNEVLESAYYWLRGFKSWQIETIMGISNVTVTSIAQNLSKLVSHTFDFNDIIPGGDGFIVEIDEEKLDRVKYHRGSELTIPGYCEGLSVLQTEDFFWVKFQIELQIS
ncbi:hypothetical protein HZS_5347 [Henneguya salminicola]|nr:hypothetical protein HZS_5347 [Henneguya salminicola]